MSLVIRLGNLIEKHKDKECVSEYLTSLGDSWTEFVQGELKTSNDRNNINLGGQQSRLSMDEEEDNDKDFELNMDKIMSKFTNFNNVLSSN